MVMAPPHFSQWRMTVRKVGPLTTHGGVTFGLRTRKCARAVFLDRCDS
jgi:hypothetical protein